MSCGYHSHRGAGFNDAVTGLCGTEDLSTEACLLFFFSAEPRALDTGLYREYLEPQPYPEWDERSLPWSCSAGTNVYFRLTPSMGNDSLFYGSSPWIDQDEHAKVDGALSNQSPGGFLDLDLRPDRRSTSSLRDSVLAPNFPCSVFKSGADGILL